MGTWVFDAGADVRLPAVFGDNMMFQRDKDASVWGWADPGEQVSVEICGQSQEAIADEKGSWRLKLTPMRAGGPFEMVIKGKNVVTVKNVLVGEVWVCSGQSNMGYLFLHMKNSTVQIAAANHSWIRMFRMNGEAARRPLADAVGGWVECSSETIPGFSAVAYYFGRRLLEKLDVPIGLMGVYWGGTEAECWVSQEALSKKPELEPLIKKRELLLAARPEPEDGNPSLGNPSENPALPCGLFNGMLSPLIPFTVRGFIWYQGESNAMEAKQYETLFPTLIEDWRSRWDLGDVPFLFVQLPNFISPTPEPGKSDWADLREAQMKTLSVPNTGMVVTIDIGEPTNIHPFNKLDVGLRLASLALSDVYHVESVGSGPLYDKMVVERDRVEVLFKQAGSGLTSVDEFPLKWFSICGADQNWYPAEAVVKGPDTVEVFSSEVPAPVAVRYAWASNPEGCNLGNKEGFLASPFRTDNFKTY